MRKLRFRGLYKSYVKLYSERRSVDFRAFVCYIVRFFGIVGWFGGLVGKER